MKKAQRIWLKVLVHLALVMPALWLVYLIVSQSLGTDPAEKVVRDLGFAGACILWLSLAMTPLKRLTQSSDWILFRRLLGLWSFTYLSLHLLAFLVFWAGLDVAIILEEVSERPYIIVGLSAWLLMVPLVFTSTRKARRQLGRRWVTLHKLVYLSALLGLLHIFWFSKLDFVQPIVFGVLLFVMFGLRFKGRAQRSK